MKNLFCFIIFFISVTIVFSQNAKTIEIKGSTITKTRHTNVSPRSQINDNNVVVSPLISTAITITVENSTGYYVDVMIDNNYKGTIPAWGKSIITVPFHFKTIYCQSVGETKEWLNTGDFSSNTTFKLQ